MPNLFVFAVGGTGSRVLKSMMMLLASGVEMKHTVVPIIIDPDLSNGDMVRTVDIIRAYKSIHEKGSSDNCSFFKTPIKSLNEFGEEGFNDQTFLFQIDNVDAQNFDEFIGYSTMNQSNQALISALFSDETLGSDMRIGFKGNPNMGSIVLNKFKETNYFQNFANNFNTNDRVIIVGSIFGGTGASGIPLLIKNIRSATPNVPNHMLLRQSKLGAIVVLPYFDIQKDGNNTINSDTFITKTKAALHYYSRNITGNRTLNSIYYIGEDQSNPLPAQPGGANQTNRAHFVELAAAMGIVDFSTIPDADTSFRMDNNAGVSNPRYMEYGVETDNPNIDTINLSNLHEDDLRVIGKALSKFKLTSTFFSIGLYRRFQNDQSEPWISGGTAKLDRNTLDRDGFYNAFEVIVNSYEQWLNELASSRISFIPFKQDINQDNIMNVLAHKELNSAWYSKLFGKDHSANGFRTKLNEQSKSLSNQQNSFKKFLELFDAATNDITSNYLNL